MIDSKPETTVPFLRFFISYCILLVAFSSYAYYKQNIASNGKDACDQVLKLENNDVKNDLKKDLIDQLKANKQGYSNNVWTTLGTIIGAIGMVLGSRKFQQILKSESRTILAVQIFLVLLFFLHAYAYTLYQGGNVRLMGQLACVVGSIDFYKTYRIPEVEVMLNLIFDTVLFVLLAYIIDRVGKVEVEK